MILSRLSWIPSADAPRLARWVAVLVLVMIPTAAWAQTSLSISPSVIDQHACYWMIVEGGNESMVLNLMYSLDFGPTETILGWPALDANGKALICTDAQTVLGTYRFYYFSVNQYPLWRPTDAAVTVNAAAPPPQPTSLTFAPVEGHAGNDCYVMAMGNSGSLTVDLQYMFNGAWQPIWSSAMNAAGEWRYCLNHYDRVGRYDFYDMKNRSALNWLPVSPSRPTIYVVKPPQPKSLTIAPAAIIQGQPYSMGVGNGANVTFDLQYTLNGVPQTLVSWPTLPAASAGSPDGRADIQTTATTPATPLGKYVFTGIRNTLSTVWVPVNVPLSVCPNTPPVIASASPDSGIRGTSMTVSITGAQLCSPVFSTATPGLTFSSFVWNAPFTSMTVVFTISSSAPLGTATVLLSTPAGSTSFPLEITLPPNLTKEYIHLGPRIIAVEIP